MIAGPVRLNPKNALHPFQQEHHRYYGLIAIASQKPPNHGDDLGPDSYYWHWYLDLDMARTIVWLLPWLSWMTRLHTIMTADLPCSFAVDKFEFDLCPLIRSQESGPIRIFLEEETPPTRTQNVYMIGLGGALTWDHTLPAELQVRQSEFHN